MKASFTINTDQFYLDGGKQFANKIDAMETQAKSKTIFRRSIVNGLKKLGFFKFNSAIPDYGTLEKNLTINLMEDDTVEVLTLD